jgi:hypothetical protein
LLIVLGSVFPQLPKTSQIVHGLSLGCVALSLLLLMHLRHSTGSRSMEPMPEPVFRFGSAFASAALVPFALGISGDIYVAISRIANTPSVGIAAGTFTLLLFLAFWYVQPVLLRSASVPTHAKRGD